LFIQVGDKVQKGQVVCIIEAMKLMNEIEVINTQSSFFHLPHWVDADSMTGIKGSVAKFL